MRWYWNNFLGPEGSRASSLAIPLRENLRGLAPLYLSAAGLDPLRDDTLALAGLLAEAAVPFRCDHVPGVVHGCLRMTRELRRGSPNDRVGGRLYHLNDLNENDLGGTQSWNAAIS